MPTEMRQTSLDSCSFRAERTSFPLLHTLILYLQVAQNWWLSSWAETGSVTTEPPAPSSHYLLVYAMFGAAAVILWVSLLMCKLEVF